MARKKLTPEDVTESIINTATGATSAPDPEEQQALEVKIPIKKKREKATTGPGRPSAGRTAALTLKLQPELKDYLRLRSFEETTSNNQVSIADIIEGLIIKDMKSYYKRKEKAGK